jgi:AraC-like DNA-binding protein/mannose-6-phosphate isomerase-like protein (cupin superfamily)
MSECIINDAAPAEHNPCFFTIWRKTDVGEVTPVQHTHGYIEICYFMRGMGTYSMGGDTFIVRSGDIVIINANTKHKFFYSNEGLCAYSILFTPKFIDENLVNFSDFYMLSESAVFRGFWDKSIIRSDYHVTPIVGEEFDSLFIELYKEHTQKQTGYHILQRAYMIELVTKIIRNLSSENDNPAVTKHNEAVDTVINYLKNHFRERIGLDDLAREMSYSKNYLCKVFKETTSKTIFEYLAEIRIAEACKLLHDTSRTLYGISVSVGFTDYKGFSDSFIRFTGKKPSKYRKIYSV